MAIANDQSHRILRALAEPRRIDILRAIISGQTDCGVTCEAARAGLDVSQPTFSHHVRELVLAGLVTQEPEGRFMRLKFNRELFDEFMADLQSQLS